MAIPLNDNIKINAPKPSDPRYFAPDNTPWASVVAVEAGIPLTERHDNLPVSIMGVEYWWKDGAWVVKESTTITNHISNTSNPHNVTKSQVGLSNVPNLSFSGSNTGDETILSIQSKRPLKSVKGQSLEGSGNIDLSKSDVGLPNVDNTSDANKPISTAQQIALNAKEPTIPLGTTSQYLRGDKTWQSTASFTTLVEDEFYYDINGVLRPNITTFRQVELNNTSPIPIITLAFEPTFIQTVNVNGVILTQNQYIYTAPNQLDLSDYVPQITPMTIEITYEHFINQPDNTPL